MTTTSGSSVQDPRIRRSRSALIEATVTLVAERGTAAVPLSDIAEAAGVSRPVVYQHFGDRETLLLESAVDLATRELLPRMAAVGNSLFIRDGALALVQHFAEHRAFYRAVLTSSCAFALNKALTGLLIPVNRQLVQKMFGGVLDAQGEEDFALFLTGGGAAFVNTWVVEGADPLDPEQFTDRLVRLVGATGAMLVPSAATSAAATAAATKKHNKEPEL